MPLSGHPAISSYTPRRSRTSIHSRSDQGRGSAGIHVAKERHLAVAAALWRNFFPFLKSLRLSQTPPSQLADTAAAYTLLALDVPSSALPDLQPQPFVSVMQLFGWDDMVAPQLVSRYLSHLIPNSALTEALNVIGYSSYQALSIRAWIRCVLQMYIDLPAGAVMKTGTEPSSVLAELTRLVFRLPEARNILTKAQIEPSSYKADPRQALLQFIKAAGTTYGALQTLSERSEMVSRCQEYIGDILKYIKPYLTKRGPAEGLQICYRTMGTLVRYWALILATSKAQQLLFRIIDYLLLPHALFQKDKDLLPAMLSAVKDALPLFLQGLSIISRHSQAQGAYIRQQLKMTIQQYFGRFLPSAAPVSGGHPVLLALCDSVQSTYTTHLRRIVMEVIRDDYLQFRGHAPPPRLAAVLSFVVEVFQRTLVTDSADVDSLLPPILKCLVLVNDTQVKKLSTNALQHMAERCQAEPQGEAAARFTANLRQFIQGHIAMYDQQIFSILETIAVLDQSLVGSLIPTISQSLKESEHKCGLGRNASSREAYRRLLSHLGEHGQDELRTLENERC